MNLKTLEDLRQYLESEYTKKWEPSYKDDIPKIFEKAYEITNLYDLTKEELEYVMPIQFAMEAQTYIKTMINSQKAQEIFSNSNYTPKTPPI